ncbi:MAG: pantetheine-phosphate adenylyltransferase [Aerococcus sp.]|nr:pantetheine-phosphate adenylyltransferase [Aerococcus sp.]
MTKALYAGSFDPPTFGHLDLIKRASSLFDEVIVAVAKNTAKQPLFTTEERIALFEENLTDCPNVTVQALDEGQLTVNVARKLGCQALLRGVRNPVDLEYEMSVAEMNRQQAPEIDTVCLLANPKYRYLSSSIVKETAIFNGDLSQSIPENVREALQQKLREKE